MATVTVFDHPLIQHKLAILRDKSTGTKQFRALVNEIAGLMCYEATRNLPTMEVEVETPITTAKCRMLAGKKLAIVPILRAGLGMVDAMVDLIPSAKIGHIGLYRDPETHEPVEYYCKLPEDVGNRVVFVVDPIELTQLAAAMIDESMVSVKKFDATLTMSCNFGAINFSAHGKYTSKKKQSYSHVDYVITRFSPMYNVTLSPAEIRTFASMIIPTGFFVKISPVSIVNPIYVSNKFFVIRFID